MNKEFFKTAILTCLVSLSVILAFNIWFDKELWSSGYSSFVYSIENIFPVLKREVFIEDIALAEGSEYGIQWFQTSESGKKSVIYFGDKNFGDFVSEIKRIRTTLTNAGTISKVSGDDFINVFKSGGIAYKFNTPVSLNRYFSDSENLFSGNSYVSDILFFASTSDSTETKYLYFYDEETSSSYRLPVTYASGELSTLISKSVKTNRSSDSYAFELNFDKASNGISRILFDSFIPITTEGKNILKAEAQPISYTSQESFDAVFKAFNIKKNSARTYKDTDNVLNYIGNATSLKIREDGSFIFATESYGRGVNIGHSNVREDLLKFANALYKNITNSDGMLILKDAKVQSDNSVKYGLIYSIGNTPLYLPDIYAAHVTVKDGYILEYEHTPMEIVQTSQTFSSGSVIEAYDTLYNTDLWKEKSDLTIESLVPVNYYADGEVVNKWYIEFSDGSHYFL